MWRGHSGLLCRESSRHMDRVENVCRAGRRHEWRRSMHECVRHIIARLAQPQAVTHDRNAG
jgi:hypothetical protein